jgi:HD-GYP domain-containing protein (c-di-GMP phosphodiesterase class II)
MPEKESFIPLSKALMPPEGGGLNRTYIDIILQDDITVLCVNQDAQKKRLMSFKILYGNNNTFWQNGGSWKFYLSGEELGKLKEKAAVKSGTWENENPKPEKEEKPADDSGLEELEGDTGYGSEYKAYAEMSVPEKNKRLSNNKQQLDDLIAAKSRDAAVVTQALVDTTKSAALINQTALEDAIRLADDEAKKVTQTLVDSTNEMIKSSSQLMASDVFNDELMTTLVEKSNGTIVQHMTRVYLNGIAFLSYYNKLVSTSSAIQKLRVSFATKYRKFYHSLLPHVDPDDIGLERVFLGGMRAIPTDLYFKWAVGFLIHDIGKAAAIEYHEGESAYDRNIVIEHVKMGYKSITTKTNYPIEASLITGYHHEYYGNSAGYGYFRAYLQQYKKQNPEAKQDYCISYEIEPMLDYQALAYFPAKVLEIIDIYDSVTDPNRVYRKAMTTDEALAMMREEFIVKQKKIDAILFDMFSDFIHDREKQKK